MAIDSDSIDAALNSIATKFEAQYQSEPSDPSRGGWGQFLDGPRPHRQIGLYGTAAGLLVLSLADRNETPCTIGATALLSHWWREWHDKNMGYGSPKFCQNHRLAFCALCLRNTPNPEAQKVGFEIEEELLRRTGPKAKWGDYWASTLIQDATPRYLATALATLSISVLDKSEHDSIASRTSEACGFLEKTLATNTRLTATEKALLAAGVLAAQGQFTNHKARRLMIELAHRPPTTLSENHSYFYEYRQADGEWGRDSVYHYAEIAGGIAGFLPGAPTSLRLRAENILQLVLENVSDEGFRPVQGVGRISTVEQAWCCLFLALAKRASERQVRLRNTLLYILLRQRRPNFLTRNILPLIGVSVAAYASAVVTSGYAKAFAIIASFIIFGLYGSQAIKRFFPGH